MVKLQNYITKHNIKLIDFFKKFDVDGNMSLGNNEFRQALEVCVWCFFLFFNYDIPKYHFCIKNTLNST